jgi:ABC-2 type transport system permease protein
MAYFILLAFQIIACLNFWQLIETLRTPQVAYSVLHDPMTLYISGSTPFWIALLIAVPVLTMRLIAEERRSGTFETLVTVPVTTAEIVVAKWLAGLALYFCLLAPFAFYLPFLRHYGRYPFDIGPLISLGLGLTTLGMMLVAVGVFFSSLGRNQVVAAVSTFAALFVLVVLTMLAAAYGSATRAGWTEAVRFVSVLDQVQAFAYGRLDVRFLALHLSVAVFMLFLTVQVVALRREA